MQANGNELLKLLNLIRAMDGAKLLGDTEMQTEQQKLIRRKVYAIAHGVKKKCRKSERHMLKMGYLPLEFDENQLVDWAKDTIHRWMKTCERATVHADYVESSNDGLFSIETWEMFDERHFKKQVY